MSKEQARKTLLYNLRERLRKAEADDRTGEVIDLKSAIYRLENNDNTTQNNYE